jgi:hypothetical protein
MYILLGNSMVGKYEKRSGCTARGLLAFKQRVSLTLPERRSAFSYARNDEERQQLRFERKGIRGLALLLLLKCT